MPELRRSTRSAAKDEPLPKKAKTEHAAQDEPAKSEPKTAELQVGDQIPDLTLLDENSNEVLLRDAAAKSKYLVIFAYPKASTPGCTRQACGFQKNYALLQKLNTAVFGLSADAPKSQLNFVTKQHLEYPLLSDPTRKLIGLLGAKKSPSGVKRSHWIFVDGVLKVKKVQVSPEVSVNSALADVEELSKTETKEDPEKEEPKEEPKEEKAEPEEKDEPEEKGEPKVEKDEPKEA